jgi:lipopolysaccharide/colanic/teichoic acid biosynthesis glycosyltransferase
MTIRDMLLIGAPFLGTLVGFLSHWLLKKVGALPIEEWSTRRTINKNIINFMTEAQRADPKLRRRAGDHLINRFYVSESSLDDEFNYWTLTWMVRNAVRGFFDRTFALVALIAVAPLLVGISLIIVTTSRGPVVFRQMRKSRGRVFAMYKFRSLRLHTDHTKVGDPRVTKIGLFLRRTGLDDLPQLWNVLTGDMAIVGPRTHALEHDDLYERIVAGYMGKHGIKPGIIGWAQIHEISEKDLDERRKERRERRLDLFYLKHRTLWLDAKIVVNVITRWLPGGTLKESP